MTANPLTYAIAQVNSSISACCKFISANDIGKSREVEGRIRKQSHQYGFYISNEAGRLMFDCRCEKGQNEDCFITIRWNDDFETSSRFIYYGQGTRNEARITRYGDDFEYLKEDYLGSLLVLCRQSPEYYTATVLTSDDDIETFLSQFSLPMRRFNIIDCGHIVTPEEVLQNTFNEILAAYATFPETKVMSKLARESFNNAYGLNDRGVVSNPDSALTSWLNVESMLFYQLEEKIYQPIYSQSFRCCQDLIQFSNEILNRRKSRAGKSLEHHLASVFDAAQLRYEEQCITEGNRKPDFIFPGSEEYHNYEFPAEDLVFLGAKTTCKDRWRQVLNEAARIDDKFLFTLQPGISTNQLQEMRDSRLTLVVPRQNKDSFDPDYRDDIYTLHDFVSMVKVKQEHMPHNFLF